MSHVAPPFNLKNLQVFRLCMFGLTCPPLILILTCSRDRKHINLLSAFVLWRRAYKDLKQENVLCNSSSEDDTFCIVLPHLSSNLQWYHFLLLKELAKESNLAVDVTSLQDAIVASTNHSIFPRVLSV